MPVPKQYHTTPAMREAIVLDLGDIGAQASRIRAAAETQAQQIIAQANDKAEQIAREREAAAQERGYNEGLEKGLAEGREQGHAEALAKSSEELRQLTAAWSQVVSEWEQQRVEMEREARQSVLQFAMLAAEKLVHRVIEVDESVVVDQAAHALSLVLSAHNASVRIHPVDHPILEDALPELLKELNEIDHIELVDDESITPGGCVVAFGQGTIDATIERQLGRLIDLILPQADQQAAYAELSDVDEPPQTRAQTQAQSQAEPIAPHLEAPVYEITEAGLVERGQRDAAQPEAEEMAQQESQADHAHPGAAQPGEAKPDEPGAAGGEA